MKRTRHAAVIVSLMLSLAIGGCSKSDAPAESASAPTTAAPAPAVAAESNSSRPTSNVVPAAAARPVVQADPIVVMHTSVGDLYVRLYEKQAPRTVSNFLNYVSGQFYDGTIFHQIEPGYVALGGGFDQRKQPKSARYPIPNEAAGGVKNVRGSIAMARDPQDPQSATSMFFFNLADNAKLNHRGTAPDQFGYCAFGQVIDGLDVLDKLSSAAGGQVVVNAVKILPMPRDDQVQAAGFQTTVSGSGR